MERILQLCCNRAPGKRVSTSQYNFDPEDLAYLYNHYIHLDHDRKFTSSCGLACAFDDGTTLGANDLFSTGPRRDGLAPNGLSLPNCFQLNLSAARDFDFAVIGKLHVQLALINALDRVYEPCDGTGSA